MFSFNFFTISAFTVTTTTPTCLPSPLGGGGEFVVSFFVFCFFFSEGVGEVVGERETVKGWGDFFLSGRRYLSSSFSFSGVVFLLRLVFFDGIFVFSGEERIKMKWRGTEVLSKKNEMEKKKKKKKRVGVDQLLKFLKPKKILIVVKSSLL